MAEENQNTIHVLLYEEYQNAMSWCMKNISIPQINVWRVSACQNLVDA